MAYLSDYTEGRDNNFNLLRLLFALCVVVAHGFNIYSNSPYDSDPVIQFSYGFGFAALDAFFVLSGFMITSSLIRRKDPVLFFVARWLRIFPALIVVTIVVSLLLGPLVTKVSLSEYFLQLETYTYLIVTGLTTDPDMTLPGVFFDHAAVGAVNRSIWTLRYELLFYIVTAFAFFTGIYNIKTAPFILGAVVIVYILKTLWLGMDSGFAFIDHIFRFGFCFAIGSAAYFYQNRILIKFIFAIPLAILAYFLSGTQFEQAMHAIFTAYFIFWCAYIPIGWVRQYNKVGDYSYGIYIMHWPIASAIIACWPSVKTAQLIPATVIITVPLAILCWHFVEKPALKSVPKVSLWVKFILSKQLKINRWVK